MIPLRSLICALCLPLLLLGCRRQAPSPRPPMPSPMAGISDLSEPGSLLSNPRQGGDPAQSAPLPTWTLVPAGTVPALGGVVLPEGTRSAPEAAASPSGGSSPDPADPDAFAPTPVPPAPVPDTGPGPDPEILGLMRQLDGARILRDVETLVAFGTRHSLSEPEDAQRGIGAARAWLLSQLDQAARGSDAQLEARIDDFEMRLGGKTHAQGNVVASLTGIGRWKRFIYLLAHLDSRADEVLDAGADAPGADDNASGVAVTLALVRLLSSRQWDGSLRFLFTSGEEQGMHGAEHHAERLAEGGLPVIAVLNADTLGGSPDAAGGTRPDRARVYSSDEDEGGSRALARYAAFIAARYQAATGIALDAIPAEDRDGRAGDHMPFSENGFPAIRLIAATEDMAKQHNAQDLPARLDSDYMERMARLELALAASLALAPPAPFDPPQLAASAETPNRLLVRWAPVDEPSVAGYHVAWRGPDEPAYRDWAWVPASAAPSHEIADLAAGEALNVAVSASTDRGHSSPFGPEATYGP